MADNADNGLPLTHNRDFMRWWSGEAVSNFGTAVSTIAMPLFILSVTGSAAKAGAVSAASMLGLMVFGVPAGYAADHYPRRLVLTAAAFLQGLSLLAITLLAAAGHAPLPIVAVLALLQGAFAQAYYAASEPTLRRIVPADQLALAAARGQARESGADIIGSGVAGFLFTIARWLPFGIDAASYAVTGLAAASIRTPLGPGAGEELSETVEGDAKIYRRLRQRAVTATGEIREGLKFVRATPYLRFFTLWSATSSFALNALLFLMIVVARITSTSADLVGFVGTAATAGGLLGALVGPKLVNRIPGKLIVCANSWIMLLAALVLAVARGPMEVAAAMAAALFVLQPSNVVLYVMESKVVPDKLQGRVSSVLRTAGMGLAWMAPALAGILLDEVGRGLCCLILAAVFLFPALLAQFSPSGKLINTVHVLKAEAPVTSPSALQET